MKINNSFNKIILGQILADGYVERTGKNCRLSFSFGTNSLDYANWISDIFSDYCSKGIYSVNSKTIDKLYINYRLKTKTLDIFNQYREMFYKNIDGKSIKIVPTNIQEIMCPIVLAHLIMGDGTFSKKDKRIRISTYNFTFNECNMLADSITKNCNINCKVLFDRVNSKNQKQYILTIGKKELIKVQKNVSIHMHKSMLYRIGMLRFI